MEAVDKNFHDSSYKMNEACNNENKKGFQFLETLSAIGGS